jgi:hypothetical protein
MSTTQYALRIAVDGGDSEVVVKRIEAALVEAGAKGSVAFDRTSASTDRAVAQLKRLADGVRSDIDPLHAAQTRLNADMERYAMLAEKGALSAEELGRAQAKARERFEGATSVYTRGYTVEQEASARNVRAMIESHEAQLNPLAAAQNRLNKELAEYKSLAASGALSTEQLSKAQAVARQRFEDTSRAIARERGLLKDEPEVVSSRQRIQGRLNLGRQGADVFTTAAMGMSPAMIAIQQGPQILDAMAMAGIKLSSSMVLAAGAVTALGVGVLVVGGDAARSSKDLATFTAMLTASADGADYAAERLAALSRDYDAMGANVKEARGMVGAFLKESVNSERLDEFGRSASYMAKVMGEDIVAASQKTGKAFTGTYKDLQALDQELNFLEVSERKQIRAMFESGQAAEARNLAFAIFTDHYAKAYNESLTEGDRLTRGMGAAWDSLVSKLGQIGPVEDATSKIGELIGKLGDWLDQYRTIQSLTDDELEGRVQKTRGDNRAAYRELGQRRRALMEVADENPDGSFTKKDGVAQGRFGYAISFYRGAEGVYKQTQSEVSEVEDAKLKRNTARLGDTVQSDSNRQIKEAEDRAEAEAKKGAGRAESLRRQVAAMEAGTRATIDLSLAYLKSDAEALKAEASMRALTEQTRRGGDETAHAAARQRHLNDMIADRALRSAQSVNQMGLEAEKIAFISASIEQQGISRARATERMEKEFELKNLTILADQAEGETKKLLLQLIERFPAAYDKLAGARRKSASEQATEGHRQEIALLEEELRLIRATADERAVAMAEARERQALEREGYKPGEDAEADLLARERVQSAGDVVRKSTERDREQYLKSQNDQYADSRRLAEAELNMRGMTSREIERQLAIERKRIELDRTELGLSDAQKQNIIDMTAAEYDRLDTLDRIRDAREADDQIMGGMFNQIKENIRQGKLDAEDFGDALAGGLREAVAQAIILRTINPLSNWVLGTNLPTSKDSEGGGILSRIFDMFGSKGPSSTSDSSGGGMTAKIVAGEHDWLDQFLGTSRNPFSWVSGMLGYASGVESAPGGRAQLAEDGYELIIGPEVRNLKPGTTVKNHNATRDILRDITAQAMPAHTASAAPQKIEVALTVGVDETGNIRPFVERISGDISAQVSAKYLDDYDRILPDRVSEIGNDSRVRR